MSKSKDNKNVGISLRQVSEGQLLKYTNMVKGWQPRWFILDPHTGMLEYFMSETEKRQRPRASLHLAGAIVVPSEEDSYTFSVNAANEDSFKLRAVDAKERQYWVNRIRVVAQAHNQVLAESNPPLFRDHSQLSNTLSTTFGATNSPSQRMLSCNLSILDAFGSVRDYLRRAECEHQRLIHDIEDLPSSGPTTTCTDTEILLLKATSQATLLCLEQCLAILHYQQQQPNKSKGNSAGSSPLLVHTIKKPVESKLSTDVARLRSGSAVSALSDTTLSTESWSPVQNDIAISNIDDESEYVAHIEEPPTALPETGNDEYKGRMLKLLSQLKLGTELTRTNLPVFFCESRSLLQVIADGFRQPQLLIKLAAEENAEHRMSKVVRWYLGCIRACQLEMTAARKPFNPVIGETFKCIWNLKDDASGEVLLFRFLAEQVSHNPPVSAFYMECPQRNINVQGSLSVKAKFMGMYVGVTLGGDLVLEMTSEKYEMSYPSLYLRSFLSEPWMEFGGKINVNCPESKMTAGVVFQTKPFYGGKPHQITAEMKLANGNTGARLSGDWMLGAFELTWVNGATETVDVHDGFLEKKIRPIGRQSDQESTKLWYPVKRALLSGDLHAAAEHKKMIEERQRQRALTYNPIHFVKNNDTWIRKK